MNEKFRRFVLILWSIIFGVILLFLIATPVERLSDTVQAVTALLVLVSSSIVSVALLGKSDANNKDDKTKQ